MVTQQVMMLPFFTNITWMAPSGVPWEFDAEEGECTVHYEQDPGFAGQHLTADAEGLTIYYGPGLSGYLLAWLSLENST